MYFFVSSHSLLQKLHTLYQIINSNNSNSEYFIFEIVKNKLKIIVLCDSENIVNTYIKVNVKKYTKEKVVVSTKLMIDVLTTFPNETLFFKKKKIALNIFSEQGSYKIPIYFHKYSMNFFKKKESIFRSSTMKITLFSNILSKILNQTLFAVGDKKFQPILNGVFFQFSPYEANFVATDTFRMVKYTIKNLKFDKYIEFTIPKKSLDIIREILKNEKNSNIVIEYNNKINIVFHFQNHIFSCRLINQKYPNYNSVIPNNNCDVSFVINRLLLLNTIRRISIFSKKKKNFIHLHLNRNKLKIFEQKAINNYNFGSKIKCKPIFDDLRKIESIQMGFNSKFLIEILSSLNENFISFELYHSNKIGILRPFSNKNKKKKESISILIMSTI
ncbi:DNA polymerase III subunit beta [Blattabacterium sp. (Blattella germanica) str. Bge]|uniref:DNA polymerase III subunit beta n=1 Tax=Blattabacterium sp. (Blattella germanica) TaxID=624186 RepID=UPI0001BB62D2|nr:DNA polymerase III subunit beta [Blattabacterium sp. (Blattella germanica)]ACY40082.1 DNA polymerase III subunit beta [Blattabacterium sp. (Blattella germanica) str. Bge]